ncbi:unnamed protein product [Discosporangium mesarthrocarpum]
MVEYIVGKHGHILTDRFDGWVPNLPIFADAIRAKTGFGEVTEKCVNGIKFQGVVLPNGLLCDVSGPVVGRRHDAWLLKESNLNPKVRDAQEGLPVQYVVYGDTAYPMLSHVKQGSEGDLPWKREKPTRGCPRVGSVLRRAFGKVLQLWPFLDFENNSKLQIQPNSHLYIVGALLTNMHTFLYGGQTGHYFDLNPPGL